MNTAQLTSRSRLRTEQPRSISSSTSKLCLNHLDRFSLFLIWPKQTSFWIATWNFLVIRCPIDRTCHRYDFLNDGKGVHVFRILKVMINIPLWGREFRKFKIYNSGESAYFTHVPLLVHPGNKAGQWSDFMQDSNKQTDG